VTRNTSRLGVIGKCVIGLILSCSERVGLGGLCVVGSRSLCRRYWRSTPATCQVRSSATSSTSPVDSFWCCIATRLCCRSVSRCSYWKIILSV